MWMFRRWTGHESSLSSQPKQGLGLSDFKIKDDRFQSVGTDFEARNGDRQPEASAPGAAGIHVEQAVDGSDLRNMGVAGNNDIDALSCGAICRLLRSCRT